MSGVEYNFQLLITILDLHRCSFKIGFLFDPELYNKQCLTMSHQTLM